MFFKKKKKTFAEKEENSSRAALLFLGNARLPDLATRHQLASALGPHRSRRRCRRLPREAGPHPEGRWVCDGARLRNGWMPAVLCARVGVAKMEARWPLGGSMCVGVRLKYIDVRFNLEWPTCWPRSGGADSPAGSRGG